MAADNATSKFLTITKIVQAFLIFAVLVYAVVIYVVVPRAGLGVIPNDDPFLITMVQVLGIVSVVVLALGYILPWLVFKWSKPETHLLFITYITRAAFFLAVGVFGCILGVFGAGWQITLPFIAASGLSLIITFPTGKKWKGFLG
jgi:hypothetical protein